MYGRVGRAFFCYLFGGRLIDVFNPDALKVAVFLSVLNNRLVAMFATPLFERFNIDKRWLMYVAGVTGMLLSLAAQVNFFATGFFTNPLIGIILSGIVLGGGASLLHDVTDGGAVKVVTPGPVVVATEPVRILEPIIHAPESAPHPIVVSDPDKKPTASW
jgi:hypothetical protein